MLRNFMIANGLLFVAVIALYAAAVARRLRDAGRSPLWGLLPIPFASFSLSAFTYLMIADSVPFEPLFLSVFASNTLYLAAFVILILMLTARSKPLP